jgi:eukaryotic-like serine/threonine-protein kinase
MDAQRHDRFESVLRQAEALDPERRESFLTVVCAGDDVLRTEVEARLSQKASAPSITAAADAALAPSVSPETQVDGEHKTESSLAFQLIDSIALDAVGPVLAPRTCAGEYRDQSDGDLRAGETATREADQEQSAEPSLIQPREADPMVGRRIGPYQVTARIGGGGMGSVYRAARIEEFAQQVAVKLIKRGMDSDVIVRRFQTEIHVQAALGKHPNITALLDAGTTEDGRPYFVMEYVDGQRIDEYCDSHRLDVPARLKLFRQVCGAVHFAHQNAVIHRDLKPSNILVTADGTPKLIDFGIAKLVHPESAHDGTEGLATLTRTGERVMTPDYASPEQVQGEPITTASDVYALGVVLYLLLTGRKPYRLKTGNTSEIFQAICEQVPERPSTSIIRRAAARKGSAGSGPATPIRTSGPSPDSALLSGTTQTSPTAEEIAAVRGYPPERLKRILTGDLDTIVLMALRKEPDRRYASAEQFADDLERYLEGLPVRAHRDSAVYRTTKFVRRHRAAVAIGSLLVLALVGGVIGTTRGLIMARRERDRAERSFLQARQAVNQFYTRVSEERLLNQPGFHPLRKTLLLDAQRFYEEFLRERGGDLSLRAELATARANVARIVSKTGSTVESVGQFQQSINLWESLLASEPDDVNHRQSLARALNDLGLVLMYMDGRHDDALNAFRRAQDLIEPLATADLRSPSLRHDLSRILQNIAQLQFDGGHPQKAIENIQRSLAIESQLAEDDPQSLESKISRGKAHAALGQILVAQPDGFEPAIAAYEKAIEFLETVVRERPELGEQTYELAMFLGHLSSVQQRVDKLDSALASTQKALELIEQLNRQYPGLLNYQGGLASTYNMMSDVHRRRLESAEALEFAQKAQALLKRLVAEHPEDLYSRIDLAKSHNNIGRLLQEMGEPVEALQSFQHAVDLYESIPNLDPRNSYNLACNIALCIPLIGARNGSANVVDVAKLTKGDQLRRQRYGDRAVELLHRTMSAGFVNHEILEADTDLDPIRERPDFRALFTTAGDKAPASAK